MIEDYVTDLLQVAARIVQIDDGEGEVTDKREWQANKDEYDALVEGFNKLRDEFIDKLLEEESGHSAALADFEHHIVSVRETADPSWFGAIDYTHDKVLPELKKQAGRSPATRKALKGAPWVAGVIAVIAYFAIRFLSATPITADVETKEGIIQRAAAAEKALRYDDWMGTHVRRGGWLKGILFWPIEPTETEIKGAAEFVSLVFEGQQYADGCGTVVGSGESLTNEQVGMIERVADYIQADGTTWEEPPVMTLVVGLQQSKPC